ncbi:MAG: response regulator [Candidatus Omnitrophica bacterium]|nr:response regulator [Candidatus Omnitrophota bacterium]
MENLMDVKQVAEYLQMNKMTVYKLAQQGTIPAFKVASEWRFKKELIEQWLMNQLKGKPGMEKLGAGIKSGHGKTVLVVDDEEVIRDFFSRALTGYKVLTASGGEEALDTIRKERPDLVLLDIKMPGIDGIETLKKIKEIDGSIVVIMLSAFATLENNITAARLGAYTSIAKPFDLEEMQSVIKVAMISEAETKETNPHLNIPKKTRNRK